jgi:hypothetical protein
MAVNEGPATADGNRWLAASQLPLAAAQVPALLVGELE